jgi:hypothetical protein
MIRRATLSVTMDAGTGNHHDLRVPEPLVNIAHFPIFNEFGALAD